MGNRGPKGKIQASPDVAKIEAAMASGATTEAIAKEFGFSKTAVGNYRRRKAPVPLDVKLPPKPKTEDPRAVAQWHCDRIKAMIDAAEKGGKTVREVASLYGQYTNAHRHLSRLSGALEITESQVVRSAPFLRVRNAMLVILKKYPEALAELRDLFDGPPP